MAARIAAFDWSRTPLGPMDRWPQSLRTAVSICLGSRFPMMLWWGPGLINLYNDAFISVLGGWHPRALGMSGREVWTDTWPVIGPQVAKVMEEGGSTLNERVRLVYTRHGFPEETWFTWSFGPIRDESGRVGGLFNTCHEDTQHVLAERERDRLAEQRQLALDAARLGWWHYDPDTERVTFDRRYAEIFGVTGHQSPNAELLKRLHPDDRANVWSKVEAALDAADPKPFLAQYRVVHDDGSIRWVESHGSATFESEGQPRRATSFVGTVADITDRRRDAGRLRMILESISDAFFSLDRDWRFTYVNAQALRVLDRAEADLLGKSIWDEYPGLHGTEVEAIYRRAAAERVAGSATIFYPDHDRWYEAHAYPAHEGISVYFRDVTERVRAEEQIRRSHDTFYNLIQNNPFGVYVVDADFKLREVSLGSQKVFAHVPRPLLGRDFAEVLRSVWAEPFASEAIARFRHTLETGEPFTAESTVERRQDIAVEEAYDWRIERIMLPDGRFGVVCYFYDLSERKRWEAALRDSEERFRAAFEQSTVGSVMTDLDGRIGRANAAFCELVGRPLPDIIGRDTHTYTHPDDIALNLESVARLKIGELSSSVYEKRYIRPGGAVVHAQVSVSPVKDAGGTAIAMIAIVADLTESKRLVEARRMSDLRFRRLIEQSPLSTQILAPDGTTREVNRAWEKLWGLTPADLSGYNMLKDEELIRLGVMPLIQRAFAGEAVTIDPIPYVLDRGQWAGQARWCGAFVYPVKDDQGRVEEVVLVHEDVTDRREAQEALRESERRFRELADAMPQMVWVTRPDGFHEYFNRRWYEFTGVPEGSTDGAGWNGMFHPDDQAQAWAAWRRSLATGELYEVEYRLRHRSGEYRWTLGRALPIRDETGAIVRWFGTCTDIDGIKRLQAENEHLLAAERAARDAAEAAGRAKDRFLAALSHELRTPLTPVAMAATAMEMDARLPFEFRDDVGMIRRNVELETRLIDDLLDLSRVVSGKLHLDPRPTSLHAVVRDVLQTVGADLHDKRLTVATDLSAANDGVDADVARLQQALWNLLKNAAKFTPEGGTVQVRTHNDSANKRVVVEVSDTGRGIAPEVLPGIFEPFVQGDPETTRRYGGLGLGLAIAKAVVDLHGGTITAASDGEDRGATFSVSLPLRTGAARTVDRPVDGPAATTNTVRLLLVEDHADTARTLTRLLRLDGMDVIWAGSIAAAVELASQHRFDLLVSDLGLPDGSGHDLMRRLRTEHRLPGIAMSGYGMEEDVRRSREAGFDEHLTKPVSLAQLRQSIRRVAARSHGPA